MPRPIARPVAAPRRPRLAQRIGFGAFVFFDLLSGACSLAVGTVFLAIAYSLLDTHTIWLDVPLDFIDIVLSRLF
jgi:hypothetical protein